MFRGQFLLEGESRRPPDADQLIFLMASLNTEDFVLHQYLTRWFETSGEQMRETLIPLPFQRWEKRLDS